MLLESHPQATRQPGLFICPFYPPPLRSPVRDFFFFLLPFFFLCENLQSRYSARSAAKKRTNKMAVPLVLPSTIDLEGIFAANNNNNTHARPSLPKKMARISVNSTMASSRIPGASSEWRKALAEVKRDYLNRKYRSCSTRCGDLLSGTRTSVKSPVLTALQYTYPVCFARTNRVGATGTKDSRGRTPHLHPLLRRQRPGDASTQPASRLALPREPAPPRSRPLSPGVHPRRGRERVRRPAALLGAQPQFRVVIPLSRSVREQHQQPLLQRVHEDVHPCT